MLRTYPGSARLVEAEEVTSEEVIDALHAVDVPFMDVRSWYGLHGTSALLESIRPSAQKTDAPARRSMVETALSASAAPPASAQRGPPFRSLNSARLSCPRRGPGGPSARARRP